MVRTLPAPIVARRAARLATHTEVLVWVSGKNRTSGAVETMGLWTGSDHQTFTIRGQVRTYYGAGNVLQVPPIMAVIGLDVRTISVGLASIAPETAIMLRGYDPRFAPAEIHRAEYDEDGNLLAEPERLVKGWINGAPIVTPPIGGTATATVDIVSNARMLTRYGNATKSDQYQRRRQDDRIRRYATLTQSADVYWGEEKASPSANAARPSS